MNHYPLLYIQIVSSGYLGATHEYLIKVKKIQEHASGIFKTQLVTVFDLKYLWDMPAKSTDLSFSFSVSIKTRAGMFERHKEEWEMGQKTRHC